MPRDLLLLNRTGFIGGALAAEFARSGKWRMRGLSSKDMDLRRPGSVEKLRRFLTKDTVLILAAGLTRDRGDTWEHFTANMEIVTNVSRALEKRPPRGVVFLSTAAVYGETAGGNDSTGRKGKPDLALSEKSTIRPACLYGIAKYSGERILTKVSTGRGFPLLIVRPSRVYGPGDTHDAYGPPQFIRSILSRRAVRLFGDGRETRDFLFAEDLARAVRCLVEKGASGTYGVASGETHSFREVADILMSAYPRSFRIEKAPRNRIPFSQGFDVARFKKTLPGFRFTGFREGLLRTFKAEVKNRGSSFP